MYPELGFYGLAGHVVDPLVLLDECRQAEALGLGSVFLSERFNVKEVASLSGAAAAVSTTLGVATGVTNHNTRHPMVTAAWCSTVHKLSRGRFALGIGRGFPRRDQAYGLAPATMARMEDAVGLYRRLWRGETVLNHDGPAGRYPALRLDPDFDFDIPVLVAALGLGTMAWAGRVMDGVILHTFFSDEALQRCVATIRRAADEAGRDPASVRIWSVLATLCDRPEDHPKDLVARMGTYLQAYGDALVAVNDWDPAVLQAFRADEVVAAMPGAIDAVADAAQIEHIAGLIPDNWYPAAVGDAATCARRVVDQFDCGADGVILHGSTPTQIAEVLAAYGPIRPTARFEGRSANPGR